MKQKPHIVIFLLAIFLFPQMDYAQVDFNKKPDDDLGNLEDAFQENFFEALKQKGIENTVQEILKSRSKSKIYVYLLKKNQQ